MDRDERRPAEPDGQSPTVLDDSAAVDGSTDRRGSTDGGGHDQRGRRPKRRGLGEAIGNAIVGLDHQVFRATRPPVVLVEAARPVRGPSGMGGGTLIVAFPDDIATVDEVAGSAPAPSEERPRDPAAG